VDVLPKLDIQASGRLLTLTWPSGFILQAAASPAGPYGDVAGATSPYLYDTAAQPLKFFRLRSQPFALTTTPLPGGQMFLSGHGVPGCNFIIQASTDLSHWVNLATNASPLALVDADAGLYPGRFYRAIPALATGAPVPDAPPVLTAQPVSQSAGFGNGVTLTVTATGLGPFTYQWRLNGNNLAGATGSSLTLSNLQFTDAGSYSVTVGGAAGSVTSQAAVLTVAPRLSFQAGAQGLTLTWPWSFILQAAANPAGPYADVPGASSPYVISTQTDPQKYFRLR